MDNDAPQESLQTSSQERDYLLPGSILIAGILISGSIIYLVGNRNGSGVTSPSPPGSPNGNSHVEITLGPRDVILGDPNAPVTFVEYGDYQCPFCARFYLGAEAQVREEYVKSGKVRMIFRNLHFLGPESTAAALAAECAKDQGKFWAYHDHIYETEVRDREENNGNLTRELFVSIANDLKMDISAFTTCFDSNKYQASLAEDNASAHALGVNSTPMSFVNGDRVQGALPFATFKDLIDKALAVR